MRGATQEVEDSSKLSISTSWAPTGREISPESGRTVDASTFLAQKNNNNKQIQKAVWASQMLNGA